MRSLLIAFFFITSLSACERLPTDHYRLNVDEKSDSDRVFWVRTFGKELTPEEVSTEAKKDNYRPATIEEAKAFQAVYPNFERSPEMFALGSYVREGDDACRCMERLSKRGWSFTIMEMGDGKFEKDTRFLLIHQ